MQHFAHIAAAALHLLKPGAGPCAGVHSGRANQARIAGSCRTAPSNRNSTSLHESAVNTTHSITATPIQWAPSNTENSIKRPAPRTCCSPDPGKAMIPKPSTRPVIAAVIQSVTPRPDSR